MSNFISKDWRNGLSLQQRGEQAIANSPGSVINSPERARPFHAEDFVLIAGVFH